MYFAWQGTPTGPLVVALAFTTAIVLAIIFYMSSRRARWQANPESLPRALKPGMKWKLLMVCAGLLLLTSLDEIFVLKRMPIPDSILAVTMFLMATRIRAAAKKEQDQPNV
jgi:hypothetical protein